MRPIHISCLAAALLAAACTTTPPTPPANLALAQAAIESAHTAGADEAAQPDMSNARAKLQNARLTNQSGNTLLAAQLAEEAEIDAHVARAKAAYLRSAKALDRAETDLRVVHEQTPPTSPR